MERFVDTVIIGSGDVVEKRLFPALMRKLESFPAGKRGFIDVFSLDDIKDLPSRWGFPRTDNPYLPERTERVFDIFSRLKDRGDVVAWVAVPSDWHLYYLDFLDGLASFVVVEKPVVACRDDLSVLDGVVGSDRRKRIFFLSYYLLEKALPLMFLRRPRAFYLKYLDGDVGSFLQMYLKAGGLRELSVGFVEAGDDRRLPEGGQLVETMVHHCLVASLFVGFPQGWGLVRFRRDELYGKMLVLEAVGRKSEKIRLSLKKGFTPEFPAKRQYALLRFAHAVLEADFDRKTAKITDRDGNAVEVSVKAEFSQAYAVQCDMVYRCFLDGFDPSKVDGLYNQKEVLEWLFALDGRFPADVVTDWEADA